MKLSDIFSLNLNSKGGAKLFKKIANKYNLDYKQVRKSVEENTDKYGYYNISKLIREGAVTEGEFDGIIETIYTFVNNIEITAIFLIHDTDGIICCSKLSAMLLRLGIKYIENKIDNNNANVYIKVDENDTYCVLRDLNEFKHKADYKGTLIDRFILSGIPKEEVEQMFVPISKEEYERFATEVNELAGV